MIKWDWFWKLLKQLFSIWLISCFILLGGSFVNAWSSFQVVWISSSPSFLDSQYEVSFLKWWWLLTSFIWYWREILALRDNVLFWWTPEWMPYIYAWHFNWYYSKVFSCDSLLSWNDYAYPENCSPFDINLWNWPTIFRNFFSHVNQWDVVYYSYDDSWRPYWRDIFELCFNSTWLNKSLCFKSCTNYNWGGSDCQYNLSGSLDFWDMEVKFSTVPYSFVWQAPWQVWYTWNSQLWQTFTTYTGSRLGWVLSVNSWYTNSEMIDWYECIGFQPALCYWWFPITDIFQPDEQFEDFTWYIAGQGATVFEIYNLYSWGFSSLEQFLNTVLARYQNWQINQFKTEPKALLMLGAQLKTSWLKTSSVVNYCDLLLNNNNSNVYTWKSVDWLTAQSCLRNKKTRESLKTSQWLDISFQTTTWWVFWNWEDIDFNPDTFFSNLMWEITSKLDWTLSGGMVWIIPWYIIIFTLAFIFIRLISH